MPVMLPKNGRCPFDGQFCPYPACLEGCRAWLNTQVPIVKEVTVNQLPGHSAKPDYGRDLAAEAERIIPRPIPPNPPCAFCGLVGAHRVGCPRWSAPVAPESILAVPEPPDAEAFLQRMLDTRRERGASYGTHYRNVGRVLAELFPEGLDLRTAEDFGRMHHVVYMLDKLHRYCRNFRSGGHQDSLLDLAVYAALCLDVDARAGR